MPPSSRSLFLETLPAVRHHLHERRGFKFYSGFTLRVLPRQEVYEIGLPLIEFLGIDPLDAPSIDQTDESVWLLLGKVDLVVRRV